MKHKSIVSTNKIADFFGMSRTDVNKNIAKGNRLDLVYSVLSKDNLTLSQKKDYLRNTSLSEGMKNNLFERYMGDYGFEYCRTGSNSLEVRI